MKFYQQFFAELKRRKVFRVSALYGITAFVVLQVADLLGEGLRLGETFLPFVTAVVLLGFPLAIVLAWAFEFTPEGLRKTGGAQEGEIAGIVAQPISQRWPAGLMALVGVGALVAGAWWVGKQSSAPADADPAGRVESVQLALPNMAEDPRPSIAVLPFVNMSADEGQEYFSDGMTEEILNTLARIRELRVAGRTSAFAYKGENKDLREIGSELGVGYLVEGSVRKAGDQLRITAQLIDASDGSHLWSEQYDRAMDDVFAIQTEIATAIADALTVPLGLGRDDELVTPTGDLAAYDLYLAGRRLMRERGRSLVEAIRLFQAAVDRDSSWAPGWAALAEATEISIWYPGTFENLNDRARELPARLDAAERAANRALELDPRNPSAIVARGSVHRDRGAWIAAEAAYRRAIDIDPDNAEAHQQYGELLGNLGRMAESVRALDRAVALDPASVRVDNLAFSLERDGRRAEALQVYEAGLHRDPERGHAVLWFNAAMTNATMGRLERGVDILTGLVRERGLGPQMGDTTATEAELRQFLQGIAEGRLDLVPEKLRPLLHPAHWAAMGDTKGAVASFDPLMPSWIPEIWQPEFDSLRSLPEIRELLSAAGLAGNALRRTPEAERTRPLILREAAQ